MRKKKETQPTGNQPDQQPTFIVGIGASAGGVEALTQFFEQVSADSGLAYVVILHLSPDYDSQLAHILQQVTPIPVMQVTKTVRVEANQVYVVPPNKQLQMQDGTIMVRSSARLEERRAPVDMFLRTLAESHGPMAIAVILSGTGANGSMGLKRVKEKGGAVFVQNPREAAFNDMPRQAIATDLVDDILPVAQIPARLLAYRQGLGTVSIPEEASRRPEEQQQALREVFTQLRLRTGHDFSNYKRSTLLRRLERRISIHDLASLPAYTAFLREHAEETQALLKDLLISVTNFFRDEGAFRHLEQQVLPALTRQGKETLRIWVAGCATGEEAYSLAMLCAEQTMGVIDAPKVQIFATDIDEDAIATAREGVYTLNDAADVSAERLGRFFTKEGEEYRIRREIRDMILFAHHNVLKDPPFSKLDLVTCRNLLIYFNHVAQERVMETFHFALNPGGYLLLGLSETIDGSGDLYATISREHHLYQSRQVASRPYPVPESIPQLHQSHQRSTALAPESESQPMPRLSFGEMHQQILEQYAPPSIIINGEYDILHFTSRAGRYLHFAGGELSKNLLKLIRPELRLELRTALYQATQQQTHVEVQNLHFRLEELSETLTLHVRPVLGEGNPANGFILVLFEVAGEGADDAAPSLTPMEPMAAQLEDEVIRVKAQLRTANEHHELQAEELKASNEELQAMNEEMRSAAEELETGKEELQSINEELITVNQELKVKVEEITITGNNLQNLINSTDIATLFLDRSLRVNLFTPATRHLFNLIPADSGRPLSDITNRLDYQNLPADAERVLATLQPIEREVRTTDGDTFIMRVLPYRTANDHINGVVITFVDISGQKAAAEALRLSEEKYRTLFESMDEGYILTKVVFDENENPVDILYLEANAAAVRMTGTELVGKTTRQLNADFEQHWYDTFGRVAKSGIGERHEYAAGPLGVWYSFYVFKAGASNDPKVAAVYQDITERKRVEVILQQSEQRKSFLLQFSDVLRPLINSVDIQAAVTQMAMRHFEADRCYYCELEAEKAIIRRDASRPDLPSVAGEYPLRSFPLLQAVIDAGRPFVVTDVHTTEIVDESLKKLCIQLQVISFVDVPVIKNGQPVGILCITQDTPRDWTELEVELAQEIAERIWLAVEKAKTEEALRKSEERQRLFVTASSDIVYTMSADWQQMHYLTGKSFLADTSATNPSWLEQYIPPQDQPPVQTMIQEAIRTKTSFELEHRVIQRDGMVGWVSSRAIPLLNDQGSIVEWFGAASDITARKQAEEALRISEERLRLLIESADDFSILTVDAQGIINGWSEGARRLFGWSADEIIGQHGSIIFTPEDRAAGAPEQELQTARQHGRAPDERFHLRKDGSRFYVSGVTSLIGDGSQGFVKIARDLTERRQRDMNLAFLADLGEDFARLASSREIMPVVGEKLYAYYGLTRLAFAYVNEVATVATVIYDRHEPDLPSVHGDQPIVQLLGDDFRQIVQDNRVVVVNDTAQVVAPYVSEGQWRFLISVQKSEPYHWRTDQIELLETLVPRLYLALERQRFERLRQLTLLQQTEDLAKIGSWDYNQQTGKFQWSDGMYKLFGMELGQPIQPEVYFDFAVEADQAKARRLVKYLREGKGHLEIDLRIQVRAQVKTLRIKADVIGEGDQQRVLGVDLDISDQLAAQQQIQETAENLQAVLDGSPAAIGLLKTIRDPADAERIIDFQLAIGNRKLTQFFNKPLTKLLGQSARRFSQLLWDSQTLDILRHVRLTGEARYEEQRLPNDGRWLGIAVTHQDDGVLITALDITELKSIQEQQQQWLNDIEASRQSVDALGELRESLHHRSELLRAVSHDLRGNFGIISSALHLLNMADSEADRAQMMEMVLRNVRQATSLLTELLDYSRLEAGQEKRTIGPFDVAPLLQELGQSLRLAAQEQGLQLESAGPETLVAEGDRLHVHRMAQNLLINAIKYTHAGRIAINWGSDGDFGRWWFAVSDTGPGLDAELVALLNTNGESTGAATDASEVRLSGQPGAATDTSEVRLSGQPGAGWTTLRGEGIGLRIVRQLALLLEARLAVTSEVGVGTRFVVTFPRRYD